MGILTPAPYLFLIIGICIAASLGGQIAGLIAGTLAALNLLHAYVAQLGPATLREEFAPFIIAFTAFIAGGFFLGRLKDQRDFGLQALREAEAKLVTSLNAEITQNAEQAAKITEREARL